MNENHIDIMDGWRITNIGECWALDSLRERKHRNDAVTMEWVHVAYYSRLRGSSLLAIYDRLCRVRGDGTPLDDIARAAEIVARLAAQE